MSKIVKKRILYLLFLLGFFLSYLLVKPTFAKFSNDYVTDNDVVGLQLNFDLNISSFEEYEEIKVDANSYEVIDVNIKNNTSDILYYGVWYKMISPREVSQDILIGRLEDNFTSMSDEISSFEEKTASVIIKNNSGHDVVIGIGVSSSDTSIQDIEYLGGKRLITGSYKEVDYIYDDNLKKYVSSVDSNVYYYLNSSLFSNVSSLEKFTSNHVGSFLVEAWGASNGDDDKGSYTSGVIKLDKNDSLYVSVGNHSSVDVNDKFSDVRLVGEDEGSLSSRIMIAGSKNNESYISGHLGSLASYFSDDDIKKKCEDNMLDITCSYHYSGVIFKHTKVINGDSEMSTFDGKDKMIGNSGDGFVKITPVVPNIEIPTLKVKMGEQLDISSVRCLESLNGCHIVRVLPQDTSELSLGKYNASFMVSDDYGIVYRYNGEFEVVE